MDVTLLGLEAATDGLLIVYNAEPDSEAIELPRKPHWRRFGYERVRIIATINRENSGWPPGCLRRWQYTSIRNHIEGISWSLDGGPTLSTLIRIKEVNCPGL